MSGNSSKNESVQPSIISDEYNSDGRGDEILKKVELFNVGEAERHPNGFYLRRYPRYLNKFLSPDGADMSLQSTGCEIRFIKSERGKVKINLSTENEGTYVYIYRGDRMERGCSVNHKASIIINDSPYEKIKNRDFFKDDIYSEELIRIVLEGDYVSLDSIETYGREIRCPNSDELPQKTMLAYGSSITHGARSGNTRLTYVTFAGRLLNAQVLNKGLAGSCLCENEVADYFAENINYDFMVFEHGTNMYSYFMEKTGSIDETVEIIKDRGAYMLRKMLCKNPDKPIFVISPLRPETAYEKPEDFEKITDAVAEISKSASTDNCIFIPWNKIETNTSFVTTDLIHPSAEGHACMGFNLAEIIKKHM